MIDPLVICFGLGVGVLIGLTGIGGGSLMTPLLILFAGVQPVVAIGTDLAYGAITKTVGGWRHLRSGTVDIGVSKWLAVGSVPGSVAGVLIVDALHDRYGGGFDSTLLSIVAVALFIVAFTVLGRALFGVPRERHSVPLTGRVKATAVAIGLVLGVVLGMTSVGSGALVGLALIMVFRLTPHRVVGTDVFHAALMLWAAGLAHLFVGNVDLTLMTNILMGSLPGVWIGTALLPRVPATALRPTLGCVLLGSALGVVNKAGIAIPAWAVVGVPALVGLLVIAAYRLKPAPRTVPA
ncbi:MAG TPA: sulfite exporter TauE/SafE family protein [Solirubrobacteraceae bacterium]